MPEIARIARAMSRTTELSFEEKMVFVKDLQTQCSRVLMWSTFPMKVQFMMPVPRKPARSSLQGKWIFGGDYAAL